MKGFEEENLKQLLVRHFTQYPGMEMADAVKLLFQNEWGPTQDINEEKAFREDLEQELALPFLLTAQPYGPEPIGNGLARVYLSALDAGPTAETFSRLCMRTAAMERGSREGLMAKLALLRQMAEAEKLPWPAEQAAAFLDAYLAEGCPPLHHSARYVQLYKPHYRLLDTTAAGFLRVFEAVDRAMQQRPHVLVGIDGMCGAGKSTLAALLAEIYNCGVVHTDDFFLPEGLREPARLAQPGGNIHYERLAQAAKQAGQMPAFAYEVYDCRARAMVGERQVKQARLTVLEGAYCLHPKVKAACDVRVFLSLDAALQSRRILQREGPQGARRFFEQWIPMENRYFGEYAVRESCDVILDVVDF